MKSIAFTTAVVILAVLVLPAIVSLGIRFIPLGSQPSLSSVLDLEGYSTVSQTFVSQDDRLRGVALSLKNPNLRNKKDVILTLLQANESIRTSVLNGNHIQDGEYVKFLFDPVSDSKNKIFTMVLSAPTANKDDATQVFLTDNKQDWVGDLNYEKNLVSNKAVAFITLHRPASIFAPMMEIYGGWFSRLFKDTAFFIFYFVLVLGLLGYLIFWLRTKD